MDLIPVVWFYKVHISLFSWMTSMFSHCLYKGTAANHVQQFLGKTITSIKAKQW